MTNDKRQSQSIKARILLHIIYLKKQSSLPYLPTPNPTSSHHQNLDMSIITQYTSATSSSIVEYVDAVGNAPELMLMPEWLNNIETKSHDDIVAIISALSEREKVEMVVYMFMQIKLTRPGDYDAYKGDDEFSYNEVALFSYDSIV